TPNYRPAPGAPVNFRLCATLRPERMQQFRRVERSLDARAPVNSNETRPLVGGRANGGAPLWRPPHAAGCRHVESSEVVCACRKCGTADQLQQLLQGRSERIALAHE